MTISLQSFRKTQELKYIHRIRIEIKKMFALVALLQHISGKTDFDDTIAHAKEMSDKTGDIRDIQMTLDIIRHYTTQNSRIYKYFDARLKSKLDDFISNNASYMAEFKNVRKKISKSIFDIEKSRVIVFFSVGLKQIEQTFNEQNHSKNFHECRKVIKKLLYIFALIDKPLQKKLNFDKQCFRKLEENIGKYHDVVIAIELIKSSVIKNSSVLKKLSEQLLCRRNLIQQFKMGFNK